MAPSVPVHSDDEGARLLGDLLRTHLPLDEVDFPEELRATPAVDLVLRDLPQPAPDHAKPETREAIPDVDSSPSLLDEGLKARKTPQ